MAIYTVYASRAEEVQKRLDRLAKKAAGFSIPFSYTVSDEHPETVRVRGVDQVNQTIQTLSTYTVAAVDFDVECDDLIKANGWTIRARVEHGQNGNIVTGFGDKPVDPRWYTAPANCDHCKTNRFRSVTFFCENEAGEIRQVGRTCLKDYTGISPATAAMWAEVKDLLDEDMDCTYGEWETLRGGRMYCLDMVLAHAYDAIKEFGYRKSDCPGSTRDETTKRVLDEEEPTDEGLKNAALIREWLVSLNDVVKQEDEDRHQAREAGKAQALAEGYTEEEFSDYGVCDGYVPYFVSKVSDLERNCIPIALSGFAAVKHFGRLAYMPLAYERYKERKAREDQREAERAAAAATSDFVGTVGQRITIPAATAKLVTSWDGYWGTTFLYKFTDEAGNVYVWKSSKCVEIKDGMTVKGSVKEHSEYNGVKQTVITRCAVA